MTSPGMVVGADNRWRWPFKLGATIPVVWLIVSGATSPEGGVLGEVGALGVRTATALGVALLVSVAFFCRDLERLLTLLPESARAMTPKSVWWMMVIPFNFVEDFFIVADVTQSLEQAGLARHASKGWAFGWCTAQIASLLPGPVGQLSSLVTTIAWIAHWAMVRQAIRELSSPPIPN